MGASGDSVKAQAAFKQKQKLNFPLLSDPDFKMIETYGARRMKKFLGKSFLGIVRSSFLIGSNGKIEHVWDNVKAKGHAAEVLGVASKNGGKCGCVTPKFGLMEHWYPRTISPTLNDKPALFRAITKNAVLGGAERTVFAIIETCLSERGRSNLDVQPL